MLPTSSKLSFAELEKFRLPVYHGKGKEKYVYFYVLDPESVLEGNPRLRRIRKKFNHIKNKRDRDEAALRFRDEVAIKLKQGWNPLIRECGKKGFTLYETVIERYQGYLKKMLKDGVLRESTYEQYKFRIRRLEEYNNQQPEKLVYIYQFNRSYLEGYLEYIYVERDTTALTRNNYLSWLNLFCNYLRSNGYISDNPAEGIAALREGEKFRKALDEKDMKKLSDYLQEENRDYLLACQLHYYTLIRPNEMSYIRIRDININEQTIFVSKEFSKNHKDGKVTLPSRVIHLMVDLGVFNSPGDYYLFGKNFKPSSQKAESRIFRDYWLKVRKKLGFPKHYQFYSLKDTGITDAINSVGLTVVKDQARHSDISITNKYVRKEQLIAHPEFKDYKGNL